MLKSQIALVCKFCKNHCKLTKIAKISSKLLTTAFFDGIISLRIELDYTHLPHNSDYVAFYTFLPKLVDKLNF